MKALVAEGFSDFLWNCPQDWERECSCWCLWHHHRCWLHVYHDIRWCFRNKKELVFIVLIISVATCNIIVAATLKLRVEKVNFVLFLSQHHTADGILSNYSKPLQRFYNILLINNISSNQYHYWWFWTSTGTQQSAELALFLDHYIGNAPSSGQNDHYKI